MLSIFIDNILMREDAVYL